MRHGDLEDQPQARERFQSAGRRVISILRVADAARDALEVPPDNVQDAGEEEYDDEEDDRACSKLQAAFKFALIAFTNAVAEPVLRSVLFYPSTVVKAKVSRDLQYESLGLSNPETFTGLLTMLLEARYFEIWHGFVPYVASGVLSSALKIVPDIASGIIRGRSLKPLERMPWLIAVRSAGLLPKVLLDVSWVRMMYVGGEAYGTPLGALRRVADEYVHTGCCELPWWVKYLQGFGFLPTVLVARRFLPASHPLAERRTFWDRMSAIPAEFDMRLQLQGTYQVLRNMPVAMTIGFLHFFPLKWAWWRTKRALRSALFEDAEHRLQRKLKRAEGHFQKVRATVDLKSFKQPVSNIMRTTTTQLKMQAANNLQSKRRALLEGIQKHASQIVILEPAAQKNLIPVARSNILASLDQIARASPVALGKGNIRISFKGERGADAGGLFRDYMQTIADALPESGLFEAGPDAGLLPVRHSNKEGPWREELFGVGRLLALAIRRNTPLDVRFSRCLYKVFLREPITALDVARIDPHFYKHRVQAVLKKGGVAATEEALCDKLTFIGVPHGCHEVEDELCEGGKELHVTEENKGRYISLLAEHYLVGRNRAELAVMVEGFHDIIPKKVLHGVQRLHAIDLELLIAGLPDIDVEDWKAHTQGSLSDPKHKELRVWFWDVIAAMDCEQRARLLSFTCGSGRLPSQGFASFRPPFSVEVRGEVDHLPTAHTCTNQLCLPAYCSRCELEEKLHQVIAVDAGFGFM